MIKLKDSLVWYELERRVQTIYCNKKNFILLENGAKFGRKVMAFTNSCIIRKRIKGIPDEHPNWQHQFKKREMNSTSAEGTKRSTETIEEATGGTQHYSVGSAVHGSIRMQNTQEFHTRSSRNC